MTMSLIKKTGLFLLIFLWIIGADAFADSGANTSLIITSTPITSAKVNTPYSYTPIASDVDGDTLAWSVATPLPGWLTLSQITGIITTVAGTSGGYSGDNGAATSAELAVPNGVAVDSSGNIYIADTGNNRIRKVDTNGIITTVAGDGSVGYSGDNGAATSAQLNYPTGLAVDSRGNIYIADALNDRIRKVDTNGTITTVAGNGWAGYSGDNGPATSAQLTNPLGVAVDSSGNIYIADYSYNIIRKVDTNGIITTVAGDGTQGYSGNNGAATSAELSGPEGVEVDSNGNIYIADSENHKIRKVDINGIITTVAGTDSTEYNGDNGDNGAATSAWLYEPRGVEVDSNGNIYIADTNNDRIRKVSPTQAQLSGTPTSADVGVYDIDLTVSDGVNTTHQNFQITVKNVNSALTAVYYLLM